MAARLSYKAFAKLSFEERCRRFGELSSRDQARITAELDAISALTLELANGPNPPCAVTDQWKTGMDGKRRPIFRPL
jgi:hypothetical protein